MYHQLQGWSLEMSTAWLRQYEWGEEFVFQLAQDPRSDRIQRFVTRVAAMHGALEADGLLGEEKFDLVGWPALLVPVYV